MYNSRCWVLYAIEARSSVEIIVGLETGVFIMQWLDIPPLWPSMSSHNLYELFTDFTFGSNLCAVHRTGIYHLVSTQYFTCF